MCAHQRRGVVLSAPVLVVAAAVLGMTAGRTWAPKVLPAAGARAPDPVATAGPTPDRGTFAEERVLDLLPPEKREMPGRQVTAKALDPKLAEKVASHVAPPRRAGDPGPGVPASGIARTPAGAGTIVEDGQAPFLGPLYDFANRWWEAKDGQEIVVYAGVARREPEQGIVIVMTTKTNECRLYRTPIRAWGVRIVRAEGERLTLASWSGTTFIFDVARRQFVAP